ncbi:hypothetical protein Tco_1404971 [Tanacetum coccineum]
MHNNIMAVGSRARPPTLTARRYAQWQSHFMRYVDTKPNIVETLLNISPEKKAHCDVEKEAIHLLLTRIGDENYSTVDACKTPHDTFTLRDGESIESYYSRFYKMMNEMVRNQLEVATMQVNPLALVVTAQQYLNTYYQALKPHKSNAPPVKTSPSTRSYATIRHKGKEIAKPITPPSQSASEEDSDPEQAQRDKEMQKNLALIAKYFKKIYKPTNNNLKTSSNSRNKNVDTTP